MADEPFTKKVKLEPGVKLDAPQDPSHPPVTLKLYPCDLIRGGVIALGIRVGLLMTYVPKCLQIGSHVALEDKPKGKEVIAAMRDMLSLLQAIAGVLGTDLQTLALKKMDVNAQKYPVSETLEKPGKKHKELIGTETLGCQYSNHDGAIVMKVAVLQSLIVDFGKRRNWSAVYTSPLNMILALANEYGELSEQVMFLDHEECMLDEEKVVNIGHETADVLIYLLHLARSIDASNVLDDYDLRPPVQTTKAEV